MSEFSPITEAEIARMSFELEWGGDCLAETVETETHTAQILGGIILTDYYGAVNSLRRELGHDQSQQDYVAGPLGEKLEDFQQADDRRRFVDEFYDFMDELSLSGEDSENQKGAGVAFVDKKLGVVSINLVQSELHGLDGAVAARTRNIHIEVIGHDGTARMYTVYQQTEDDPLQMSAIQYNEPSPTIIRDAKLTPGSQQYLSQVVASTRQFLQHQKPQAA